MAIGRLSDYLVNKWLAELETSYLALHYDNPDIAGAYASEVFGGGYARCLMKFSFPAARAIWNITPAVFSGIPAVTVTHLALWDAVINGNYLTSISLDSPMRILGGKQLTLAPQLVAVSLD